MKRKRFIIAVLALLCIPAFAVFNEKDLGKTLSVLRYELKQEYIRMSSQDNDMQAMDEAQHQQMVDMIKKCNELSLMLYSQNEDYTFDMTYALKEVSREYDTFNSGKLPFNQIISNFDTEIDRYTRLIESLHRIPAPGDVFVETDSLKRDSLLRARAVTEIVDTLDTATRKQAFLLDDDSRDDRDACIYYAEALLALYQEGKDMILTDSQHYESASARLRESYDYAQERYKVIQRRMFIKGTGSYFMTLKRLKSNWKRAYADCQNKYSRSQAFDQTLAASEWRGPMVFGFLGTQFGILLLATLLSLLAAAILRPKVKSMQSDVFQHRLPAFCLLCGVLVFGLCQYIIPKIVDNNFFKVASSLLIVLAWILVVMLLSLIIRHRGAETTPRLKLYVPTILLGFLIIIFRVIFIPNRMMNIIFPPVMLITVIWQLVLCIRNRKFKADADIIIGWITLAILVATATLSWCGFVLLGIQIAIWWLFQAAAVEAILAMIVLLNKFKTRYLDRKVAEYRKSHPTTDSKEHKGDTIRVTWLYDLVSQVLLPVTAIISIPLCVYMALDVFDLTEISHQIFYTTFFDFKNAEGQEIFKLSFYMIVLASSLYFVFRYLNYALQFIYRDLMFGHIRRTSGKDHVEANEINLSLSKSVISILVWGSYVILTILLLRIPMGAVSIIAAGLATGLGLAMKDILNNFIYGIQLMSGRLRVGDWVECDGVRGKVTSISYQSTQIETIEGAVMSFLNAALFNKNFKNLTRNNAYEFVKLVVGVSYGTDVEKVRTVLSEALKPLCTKDSFKREIVDPKRGITVTFENFGDSSVDIAVKQYVLVSERFGYTARAKEAIYDALNRNGISIPFPQRDIHIIEAK
jgi:small-conductance mechanosensitive channel